jgi:hypothetical protein
MIISMFCSIEGWGSELECGSKMDKNVGSDTTRLLRKHIQ